LGCKNKFSLTFEIMANRKNQIEKLITEALAIEAEAAIEANALGFMARAMVQATMPHKKTTENEFVRRNGAFTLSMLSPARIGLPYGSVPRLLMAWLTTEAVRTQSRELILGDNLSGFMRELDMVPTGGRWGSITRLKTQTKRLFSTSVSCTYDGKDKTALAGFRIADSALLWWDTKSPEQHSLWKSAVILTEPFFKELTEHPVPIDMRALKAIKRSPLALDLYCWLTYRMSYLNKKTEIPWPALAVQFGSEYSRTRDFKAAVLKELRKVMVVYSDVNATEGKYGLILKPSPTHIRKKGVSFLLTKGGT